MPRELRAGSAGCDFEKEWWHFRRPGEYEPLDAPLACFGGA
jgi:D-alanyl-D-alanine dipeptidase